MEGKGWPDPVKRDLAYQRLNGFLESDSVKVQPLENSAQIGALVETIYQRRLGLCARAGLDFEDSDLEAIITAYEKLNRLCGELMYNQGWHDANQS